MSNQKRQEAITKVYVQLNKKLGSHNHIVRAKSMWKYCLKCKQKALTINQPNDHITPSRFSDYRIFCFNCDTTELITSNQYSKRQDLDFFIFDLMDHFKLTGASEGNR